MSSGFYCLAPRIWRGEALRPAADRGVSDPYGPSQPHYRERHRRTSTELGTGLTRVDIGAPVSRLPGATQPVPLASPLEPVEQPEATDGPPAWPTQDIASVLRNTAFPEFKPGLGRG